MPDKPTLVDEYVANPTNASQFLAAANKYLRTELAAAIDKLLNEVRDEHQRLPQDQRGGYLKCILAIRRPLRALVLGEAVADAR